MCLMYRLRCSLCIIRCSVHLNEFWLILISSILTYKIKTKLSPTTCRREKVSTVALIWLTENWVGLCGSVNVAEKNCGEMNTLPTFPDIFSSATCRRGRVSQGTCRLGKMVYVPEDSGSDVVKNLKKLSQVPRRVPVGHKVGFKRVQQVYRIISKRNNVNTSGNKKRCGV
nr:hypothetical protein [Tanacetum cinerariifolium]